MGKNEVKGSYCHSDGIAHVFAAKQETYHLQWKSSTHSVMIQKKYKTYWTRYIEKTVLFDTTVFLQNEKKQMPKSRKVFLHFIVMTLMPNARKFLVEKTRTKPYHSCLTARLASPGLVPLAHPVKLCFELYCWNDKTCFNLKMELSLLPRWELYKSGYYRLFGEAGKQRHFFLPTFRSL